MRGALLAVGTTAVIHRASMSEALPHSADLVVIGGGTAGAATAGFAAAHGLRVVLLDERRMREDGYLDPTFVRRRWTAFLAGVDDWRTSLWPILMWQAWREATQ